MRIGDGLPQVTGIYTNDKKVSRVENLNNVQGIKDNVKIKLKIFFTYIASLIKVMNYGFCRFNFSNVLT